jgi:hypothetical protein
LTGQIQGSYRLHTSPRRRWRGNNGTTNAPPDASHMFTEPHRLGIWDERGPMFSGPDRFRSVSGKPGGGSSPLIRIALKTLQIGVFSSRSPPRHRLPGMFVLLPMAITYVCACTRGPAVSAPLGSEST